MNQVYSLLPSAKRSIGLFTTLALFILISSTSAYGQNGGKTKITIPSSPLVAGNNVAPNVLIGFDDSGSMGAGTEFKNQGLLYYRNGSGFINSNGNLINRKNGFPNVYIRVFPTSISSDAVPDIPKYAFARSSAFNTLYFDPTFHYKAWLQGQKDYKKAWNINPGGLAAVPYHPVKPGHPSPTINLKHEIHNLNRYFAFQKGMTIPAGKSIYKCNRSGIFYWFRNSSCSWHKLSHSYTINSYRYYHFNTPGRTEEYVHTLMLGIEMKYFAATFYVPAASRSDAKQKILNADTKESAAYASYRTTKASMKKVMSQAPGHTKKIKMYRFQIKPGNFKNKSDYKKAIHNFANYFTYHRKRMTAVQSALTFSFQNFDNLKVASTAINNRSGQMHTFKLQGNHHKFNHNIYDLTAGGGTPDIQTLAYMGSQFEQNRSNNNNLIQSPCQKNYMMLFTDGKNTGHVSGFGDKDNDKRTNRMGDVAYKYFKYLKVPGNVKNGQVRRSPQCPKNQSGTTDQYVPYDCNKDLHVDTFAITLGQSGQIFGTNSQPSRTNLYSQGLPYGFEKWSDQNKLNEIDDLWQATVVSKGRMLNANSPTQLHSQFNSILTQISNLQLSASNLSANRHTASSKTLIYSASFQGRRGSLKAYKFNGKKVNIGKSAKLNWRATIPTPSRRSVFTLQPGKNQAQKFNNALAGNYNLTKKKIQYILGSHKHEGTQPGTLRQRGSSNNKYVLGGIIHSTPVYSGAVPNSVGYVGQFKTKYKNFENNFYPQSGGTKRTPTLYVEANDGMLHAFNAGLKTNGGGHEEFAFIPGAVLKNIAGLTKQNPPKRFYADATPTVGDAVINQNGSNQWATVLVAGERAGGNSIFALNVTKPSKFDSGDVLWEDSNATKGISELGKTYSKPIIVHLKYNNTWAAVFGNGYNSPDNDAVLYVVNLSNGKLIKKFVVSNKKLPGKDKRKGPDGLSTPAGADLTGNGTTDYVYAGDLHGNMWRFNLTSASKDNWKFKRLYTTQKNKKGNPRPITSAPIVSLGPPTNNVRGTMVFFGSGEYLQPSDATQNAQSRTNYLYGIWDSKAHTTNQSKPSTFSKVRVKTKDLVTESTTKTVTKSGSNYGGIKKKSTPINYKRNSANPKRGWRLNLGANGQRIITQPTLGAHEILSALSSIPAQSACNAGGQSYLYRLNRYQGRAQSSAAFGVGKLSITNSNGSSKSYSPSFKSLQNIGIANGVINVYSSRNQNIEEANGSKGPAPTYTSNVNNHRLSWRQIRRGG